jgi:hypothetical protein
MREIRKSGSEGGGAETNRRFLPLSFPTKSGNGRRLLSSMNASLQRTVAAAGGALRA